MYGEFSKLCLERLCAGLPVRLCEQPRGLVHEGMSAISLWADKVGQPLRAPAIKLRILTIRAL